LKERGSALKIQGTPTAHYNSDTILEECVFVSDGIRTVLFVPIASMAIAIGQSNIPKCAASTNLRIGLVLKLDYLLDLTWTAGKSAHAVVIDRNHLETALRVIHKTLPLCLHKRIYSDKSPKKKKRTVSWACGQVSQGYTHVFQYNWHALCGLLNFHSRRFMDCKQSILFFK
jgi:hypothetical protein